MGYRLRDCGFQSAEFACVDIPSVQSSPQWRRGRSFPQSPVVSRELNGFLLLLRQPAAVFRCLHRASTAMQGLVWPVFHSLWAEIPTVSHAGCQFTRTFLWKGWLWLHTTTASRTLFHGKSGCGLVSNAPVLMGNTVVMLRNVILMLAGSLYLPLGLFTTCTSVLKPPHIVVLHLALWDYHGWAAAPSGMLS